MRPIDTIKANKIIEWAFNNKQPPFRIELYPTAYCNLFCKFCFANTLRKYSNKISTKRLYEIVKQGLDAGVEEWIIAGAGEPFCKPETSLKIMEMIKEKSRYGSINTNGTLFTYNLIKALIEMQWDQVLFSIDAPVKEIHDYLRGQKGVFKKAREALLLFKNLKKKYKSDLPVTAITMVITNKTYNLIDEMVKFAINTGCTFLGLINLQILIPSHNKLKLTDKMIDELFMSFERAKKIAKKAGLSTDIDSIMDKNLFKSAYNMDKLLINLNNRNDKCINSSNPSSEYESIATNKVPSSENPLIEFDTRFLNLPCYTPWFNLVINPFGQIGTCSICQWDYDLNKHSVYEAWHSEIFESLRTSILNKEIFKFCKGCSSNLFTKNIETKKTLLNALETKLLTLADKYKLSTIVNTFEKFFDKVTAYRNIARICLKQNKPSTALKYIKKAFNLSASPEDGRTCAMILKSLDKLNEAEQILLKNKNDYWNLIELGHIYLKKKLLNKAESYFLKAGTLNRTNSFYLTGLGYVFLEKKDFLKAIQYFKKAFKFDKSNSDGWCRYGLMLCYQLINEKKKAIYWAQHAFRILPKDTPLSENVKAFLNSNNNQSTI